ncbi:hypothetical protein BOVATA_039450 [Babesia ovata]|uniref:Uncharacterized protein n=1 Tax=Babesia ovata TaxID=189622 RepID=A0A2H6KHI2_9APIC|nr:uncharacterized protein BOVATA_039450 [Babesia ovata]GBE62452.1 hypothetical protein BOVATA_039450 [Babesia ovata]
MCRERLIRRRLRALGVIPPQDLSAHFQALVLKLEEEHIRHYAISERRALKEADSKAFVTALLKYCDAVGIEIDDSLLKKGELTEEGVTSVLDGLTLAALEEEYTDLVSDAQLHVPATQSSGDSDNGCLPALLDKVNNLLELLGIPALQQDAPVEEIRSAVLLLLRLHANARHDRNEKSTKLNTVHMNLADIPCGIRSDSPVVTKAARVLRTLHWFQIFAAQELCKLQADIIWLSERFQELTANPVANSHAR